MIIILFSAFPSHQIVTCIFKAIRDGVIEAVLDHENGWMQSKENTDIYTTREPQLAFHERIEFCLDLHNSSVKAMRYAIVHILCSFEERDTLWTFFYPFQVSP